MSDDPRDASTLAPIKAYYFLFFAGLSCLAPYFAVIFEERGLSGGQIGLLTAMPYFIMPLAGPVWGGLGDRFQSHKRLLIGVHAGALLATVGIATVGGFGGLVALVALYSWFIAPIAPLIDNTTLEALGSQRHRYGRLRVWGTVGWGLMSPLIGWTIDRAGLGAGFVGFWAMGGLALIAATKLPVARSRLVGRYWSNMALMMLNRRWLHFLLIVFFGGIGIIFIHAYLFLALAHMGASKLLMGISMTVATLSEMVFMLAAPRLLRLGPQRIFNVSVGLLVVRLVLTGLIEEPLWILPIQLLHGCTFGTMWLAGVTYAHAASPPGLGATAQGVLMGTWWLGSGIGALLGGGLITWVGTRAMYFWVAGAVGSGFIVYVACGLLVPGMALSLKRRKR